MAEIILKNVYKCFEDGKQAVRNFNLEIKDKEFVIFVGPSGCGKSTTLRMIAGIESISEGEILIDGKKVNDVDSCDRDIAMVFQNYALYPHMTIYDNIAYSMKLKHVDKQEIKRKVEEVAHILGLESVLDRKPKELSGGQKQRVAMGRAIVRNPKAFLMDEPLSNLDAKLRHQMRTQIAKLHKDLDATMIYVTHDQVEAMTLGTKIVVLKDGVINQVASPQELYDKPANLFVASFIGTPTMNFFDGVYRKLYEKHFLQLGMDMVEITSELGEHIEAKGYRDKTIVIGVRPEDMIVETKQEEKLSSEVDVYEMHGAESIIYFDYSNRTYSAKLVKGQTYKRKDAIQFSFNLEKIHLFDINTKNRIAIN